jgi:hypothetical protein
MLDGLKESWQLARMILQVASSVAMKRPFADWTPAYSAADWPQF